ncbi:MAG: hypothetical protein ACOX3X_03255 [Eubacteriales bacterium]|jgi:hypothetical protein
MDNRFSKKIFAILLERAKGPRSWRQFAFDCGISYVQMRKLAQAEQENPPRPKLIKKIADNAFNEVDLEDLMFAAGMIKSDTAFVVKDNAEKGDDFYSEYRSLSPKDKNTVESFVKFLLEKSKEKQG